ncbi:hypothetical protein [Stenotrophomonas maltophilia]|uniref:hypothetical protein n=1 Tax=Stenotrophomonas maltophilia TaxID=40324 RepID=UPI001E473804|nr:hypothetical protein [Stenotrophomonas maltophilia]
MAAALIALMLLELLLLLFWGTDLLPHRHRPVQPAHRRRSYRADPTVNDRTEVRPSYR